MTKKYALALCAFVLSFIVSAQTKSGPKPAASGCDKCIVENQSLKKKIEALKQDTTFLKGKLAYFNTLTGDHEYSVTSFSSDFDLKVVSCKGDRAAQTVKVEFVVHHKRINQIIGIGNQDGNHPTMAYDEVGNTIRPTDMLLGASGNSFLGPPPPTSVPTDIDVRGYILFSGILGGTEMLKLIEMYGQSRNQHDGENMVSGVITIKNLKINW